jgi:cytochrome c oxidase subunit 1
LHDTYYVVGHFHYLLMGGLAFAVFAGIYYWFPLLTGRMYQRTLALWHFWLTMIGTNVTFFAMMLLGYGGMPRRYASYLPQFATMHQLATAGALLLAVGQVIFFWNVIQSWYEGRAVTNGDPWNLREEGMYTAEWDWFASRRLPMADGGSTLTDDDSDGTPVETDGGGGVAAPDEEDEEDGTAVSREADER